MSRTGKSTDDSAKEQVRKSRLIPLSPDSFIPLDTKIEPLTQGEPDPA